MADTFDEYQPDQPTDEIIVDSLGVSDQFIGILSEPSATFENVRLAGPRKKDWLVPLVALVVIVLASTMIKFTNESFKAEIKQKGVEAIQKQVQSGKMTQEQANTALQQMDSMSGIQVYFAAFGVLLGTPLIFLLIVFLYWLILKFGMKGAVTYALLLSICGLTTYINVIDQLVSLLLSFATGNSMAGLNPLLFMKHEVGNKFHSVLMFINPISIWAYYLQGIGFHKVTGLSRAQGMTASFGLFILWILLTVFVGGLFSGNM
jgi:hypothetical protein